MMIWTKKLRWAKPVLAGLGGTGWFGGFAIAAAAQTAVLPASQPLYFEANPGQVNSAAAFIARGRDCQFLIWPGSAQLVLGQAAAPGGFAARVVQMQFLGAGGNAQLSGAGELPGKINYLIGNAPARWQTGVATFAQVRVDRLYPGVNLTYHGNQRRMEYDFTVAPGADPDVIAIRFHGADKISVNAAGDLVLSLGNREIRQPKPLIYQVIPRGGDASSPSSSAAAQPRRAISGGYKMLDAHTVGFAVGDYDHGRPLVIDPILSYSTYFGGNGSEVAWKVAVDTNGFVYVAGQTLSTQLATVGAFHTNYAGGTWTGDAFVAKFSNDGSNLVYCTYLGGSQDDFAYGLALDSAGDVFLTGSTDSPDFPTNNALYPQILGYRYFSPRTGAFYNANAFVAEIDTSGSRLVYSTYLGGSGNIPQGLGDTGTGIAVDAAGNAYVTGFTASTNFPATNALVYPLMGTNNTFNHLAGILNAFLAKIGPDGTNLIYSTYFGGTNVDESTGIAVDGTGDAYIAGFTSSTNFPTTPNAFQTVPGGSTNFIPFNTFAAFNNAFVAKFAPAGTNLIYSTFLGGTNADQAFGIAVDAAGNAYVTGGTTSPNFPDTATNVPGLWNGVATNQSGFILTTNAFLAKLNPGGTGLIYSAVFGGTNFGIDSGYGVAVDPAGDAFVAGATSTLSFPTTITNSAPGQLAATNAGGSDAFVTAFNPDASALLYSACLGGAANDYGYGIAVDPAGDAYLVGQTFSSNFPTNNARQTTLNGNSDAFLAKILLDPPALILSLNGGRAQVAWNSGLPFEPELPRLFKLEASASLLSTNWAPVSAPPVLINNRYSVTLDRTNPAQFFRLRALQP